MNLKAIFSAILGIAEEVIPVFIHNPKSQKIEGVVLTTANAVASEFGVSPAAPTPPAAQ